MRESSKVVVGGNEGAQYRFNLKRGTGEFYDPTTRREGICLLPQSDKDTPPCDEGQE